MHCHTIIHNSVMCFGFRPFDFVGIEAVIIDFLVMDSGLRQYGWKVHHSLLRSSVAHRLCFSVYELSTPLPQCSIPICSEVPYNNVSFQLAVRLLPAVSFHSRTFGTLDVSTDLISSICFCHFRSCRVVIY